MDFYAFYNELKSYKILSTEGMKIICRKWGMDLDNGYMDLFFDLFNIKKERIYPNHSYHYVMVKGYKAKAFYKINKDIDDFLQEGYRLTADQIRDRLGEHHRFLPSLNLTLNYQDGFYQVPFKDLKIYAKVHRIFLEQPYPRKLHYKEILSTLQRRGCDTKVVSITCRKKYIKPIGITGYWVLNNNRVNTNTYTQTIREIVRPVRTLWWMSSFAC